MLDLDIDPKLAWALKHPERFPIDVNRASREDLLRVPGLGTRGLTDADRAQLAQRLVQAPSSRRAASARCVSKTLRA